MNTLLVYPIIPAIVFGTLNWLYWRRKGFTSPTQLVMNILIFYAGIYGLLRLIASWD